MLRQQKARAFGRIAAIAINHQDQISIDCSQRGRDGARLTAALFSYDSRAGGTRRGSSAVFGAVIDDKDLSPWEGRPIFTHDRGDAERFVQTRDENGKG